MLYESATGERAVHRSVGLDHVTALFCAARAAAVAQPTESRTSLNRLILSLLAKRPGDRPGSGGIVAQALREEVERTKERQGAGPGRTSDCDGHDRLDRPLVDPIMPQDRVSSQPTGRQRPPHPRRSGQPSAGRAAESIKTDVGSACSFAGYGGFGRRREERRQQASPQRARVATVAAPAECSPGSLSAGPPHARAGPCRADPPDARRNATCTGTISPTS